MFRFPRLTALAVLAAALLPRSSLAAAAFDPAPLMDEGWTPALQAFGDWVRTPAGKAVLGRDSSWGMLGLINLNEPQGLGELSPLVRELRVLSPDGGARLRRDMRHLASLDARRQREIAATLRQARLAAARQVIEGVEGIMDAHVRRQKLLKNPTAVRSRIAEVSEALIPLSQLTLYAPEDVGARYSEALIKLDSLRRALVRMEMESPVAFRPRASNSSADRTFRRTGEAERVLDAPAELALEKDPYDAARQLSAALRARGIASARIMVGEGAAACLVVSFETPEDRDKALDIFKVEPDISLSYRGVPVHVLLPSPEIGPRSPRWAPPGSSLHRAEKMLLLGMGRLVFGVP